MSVSWNEYGAGCRASVHTVHVGGSRDERAEAVMYEIEAGWAGAGRYMVEYTDYDKADEAQVYLTADSPTDLYEQLEKYYADNHVYTDDSPYIEKQ